MKERLHQELGFEYLNSQRCIRKVYTFYKIVRNKSPGYLCKYIVPADCAYLTGNSNNINKVFVDQNFLLILFYPRGLRKGISFVSNCVTLIRAVYLKDLYKLIKTIPNSTFTVVYIYQKKLLTRLRVILSHLREHKFRHNFQSTVNPICPCSPKISSSQKSIS